MNEPHYSVQLTKEQIQCVRGALESLAKAIRDQRYDPMDADRPRRQRADEDLIASVKAALGDAKPAA